MQLEGLNIEIAKSFLETLVIIIIILLTIILINGTSDNTKVFALLGVFAVSAQNYSARILSNMH